MIVPLLARRPLHISDGNRCPVDCVAPVETRRSCRGVSRGRSSWVSGDASLRADTASQGIRLPGSSTAGYAVSRSAGLLSEAELDEMDRAGTEIDPETDLVFNRGGMAPEFPPRHLRIASQTAELKRALAAYQAAVENYANRLADPAAYADPSIQIDDTLSFDRGFG